MRPLLANRFVLSGLAAAILCTASAFSLTPSTRGVRCTSSRCTYFDDKGRALPGTCGTKKGDSKNCYCIANENKKLSQVQRGCAATD
jgi:hypothetical protein